MAQLNKRVQFTSVKHWQYIILRSCKIQNLLTFYQPSRMFEKICFPVGVKTPPPRVIASSIGKHYLTMGDIIFKNSTCIKLMCM